MRSVIFLALLAATPTRAAAQDDEASIGEARALFEEGLLAADDGRDDDAERLFRRSLAIRRGPSTAYNLALILERRGQLEEARTLYREVIVALTTPTPIRVDAQRRADRLAPQPVVAPTPDFLGAGLLLGSGGTLAVAAAITGGLALARDSRLQETCGDDPLACPPDARADIDSGRDLAVATDVLIGVAVAAATAAAVWLIIELVTH